MMELFDSHCHLEDERFQGEVEDVLARMAEAGVTRCILASSDMPTGTKIVGLADQYPQVYGMVGFHPHEASQFREEDLRQMSQWLKHEKIVGVGEIVQRHTLGQNAVLGGPVQEHPQVDIAGEVLQLGIQFQNTIH